MIATDRRLSIFSLKGATGEDRLSALKAPFRNPGELRALAYVPEGLKPGAPLVVVLHGGLEAHISSILAHTEKALKGAESAASRKGP